MGTVVESGNLDGNGNLRASYCCGRSLFVPLFIILVGVALLLDQFHWLNANRAFSYFWPVIFILFGLEALAGRRHAPRLFWGVLAIGLGTAMIAENLGYMAFHVANLWPLLVIAFGISLLLRGPDFYARRIRYRRMRRERWRQGFGSAEGSAAGGGGAAGTAAAPGVTTEAAGEADERWVDGVAVLGGFQRRITSKNFRGGKITACMGGYQLDLSRAEIAGDSAVLDIFACFGGGEIRVPEHWVIEEQIQTLLGGCSDETHQAPPAAGAKKLVVQGTAIFGGVVIKN